MKQLLILSGKGGTGKTTIASAFIRFSDPEAYADCDVDAPNLHLVTRQGSVSNKKNYYGLERAEIDASKCISCDICRQNCRFDAIFSKETYKVNPFACEGCGVCEAICPANAITSKPAVDGELLLYKKEKSIFSTAQLKMGSGTSGLLVTEVKKQMKEAKSDAEFAIIDGSPGIGCPVIASLSGVDMVLIVAEPSLSGISDMKRIIITAEKFGIKTAVCINKFDINIKNTEKIKAFCKKEKISYMGEIPFDHDAVNAVNKGMTIADIDCAAGKAAKKVYEETEKLLFE